MARHHSGNEQKHQSRNPIQQALIRRFHAQVVRLVEHARPKTVMDVGCGEGYTLAALRDAGIDADLSGIDLSETAVAKARSRLGPEVKVRVHDARLAAEHAEKFDLVMMTEVLEHLEQPEQMLGVLADLTNQWVILSVPWEPYFRGLNFLRGKNLRRWGNDPEHINWWGRAPFLRLVERQFQVVAAPLVFPWTLVLARRR